jgi:hypothetical protein
MSIHLARIAAIGALALVASAATLTPAHADVVAFRDKGGHLTTVKVSHSNYRVAVKAYVGNMDIGDYFTFWLDTDGDNPGPEFKTEVYPNSDGLSVLRVESFGDDGQRVRCDGFRAAADVSGPRTVKISVPRSCIGDPDRVRVSVRASYDVAGPNVVDWAPTTRAFFGWVWRG